jgi:hypothetical protein
VGIWVALAVAFPVPIVVGIEDLSEEGVFRLAERMSHEGAIADEPIECDAAAGGSGFVVGPSGDPGTLFAESGSFGRPLYVGPVDQDEDPEDRLLVVPGLRSRSGSGKVLSFRIEVEEGLDIDPACFGFAVEDILWDQRSWTGTGRFSFARVDGARSAFRIILASPATTDALCRPLRTGGVLSCRRGNRVVINAWRWANGAKSFAGDLDGYRNYLINHEVGHVLGRDHEGCEAAGEPAPVMMQQTKGVGDCIPNGWP